MNERIKNYMDLCTGCNACKEFCPSDIDAREIFTAVKSQYYDSHSMNMFEKIVYSYSFFKFILRFNKAAFNLYRFFQVDKFVDFFYPLFSKIGLKKTFLLNALIKERVKSHNNKACTENKKSLKAVYFAGCFNDYMNLSSKNALKKIFDELNIELVEKNFECCGVTYLSAGKMDEYEKLMHKNLVVLSDEYDYVLTDCASCNYVLKEYKKYFPNEKTEKLAQKTINVLEFLKDKKITANKPISVTFHKPCHEDFDIVEFIKNIENINYIEADGYDECCGFAGMFSIKHPDISKEISKKKAQKLLNTNTDCIITTCPACSLGINQGLIENTDNPAAKNKPVYNLIEFIALNCTVF